MANLFVRLDSFLYPPTQCTIILILIIRSVVHHHETGSKCIYEASFVRESGSWPFTISTDYSGKVNGERDFAEDICDFLCFAACYIMVNRGFSCCRLKITCTRERIVGKNKIAASFPVKRTTSRFTISRRGARPFARPLARVKSEATII